MKILKRALLILFLPLLATCWPITYLLLRADGFEPTLVSDGVELFKTEWN